MNKEFNHLKKYLEKELLVINNKEVVTQLSDKFFNLANFAKYEEEIAQEALLASWQKFYDSLTKIHQNYHQLEKKIFTEKNYFTNNKLSLGHKTNSDIISDEHYQVFDTVIEDFQKYWAEKPEIVVEFKQRLTEIKTKLNNLSGGQVTISQLAQWITEYEALTNFTKTSLLANFQEAQEIKLIEDLISQAKEINTKFYADKADQKNIKDARDWLANYQTQTKAIKKNLRLQNSANALSEILEEEEDPKKTYSVAELASEAESFGQKIGELIKNKIAAKDSNYLAELIKLIKIEALEENDEFDLQQLLQTKTTEDWKPFISLIGKEEDAKPIIIAIKKWLTAYTKLTKEEKAQLKEHYQVFSKIISIIKNLEKKKPKADSEETTTDDKNDTKGDLLFYGTGLIILLLVFMVIAPKKNER